MHLFLIRHGETVDNVAGLYAGSRDSALTSHGVLQAHRLATHLAEKASLQHVFASNLQRAARTAEAIVAEQKQVYLLDTPVVQLASLRERDFGSDEGVKFSGKGRVGSDAETAESMTARVDDFLDTHLVPLLGLESSTELSLTCAIVAHGIILGVLYKSLCARVNRGGMTIDRTLSSSGPGAVASAFSSPFWDNTGYLECTLSVTTTASRPKSWNLHVKQVNCVSHLRDLKKTRGGIGSAAHDDKQQTLTSFFPVASEKHKVGE
ncbi:putative phosphatase [Cladobotryum mycophilum]|uniref:Phosphatase n=1 Tax=Cladobotryum mycophilum TaxID=491253 RepID=A0ABR0SIC9_9HYPO